MGSSRPVALAQARNRDADPRESDDAPLVRKTRAGDDESFAELYRRYRAEIYHVCLRRLRDPAAAEDATQDTFLRAYANLQRFDETRRLLPWLVSIATRRCIDVQRRGARTSTTDLIDTVETVRLEDDPTLDAVVAGEERRRLERALRRLAPRQRRALLLHALEGWSYADIAAAEGVSVSSTKSLLFHARDNLRRSCRRGLLGTILIPASTFRRRLRDITEPIGARLRAATEPLLGAIGGALAPSVSAMAVALAVLAPQVTPALNARRSAGDTTLAVSRLQDAGGGSHETASVGSAGPRRPSLIEDVLHPTKHATPEDTQVTSVAPSPNYEEDRTLFSAGRVPCQQSSCMVLFVSRDGGATWHRRGSRDFNGHTVLLPPSYPRDPRIFAMGDSGLEVSADGGDTFKVVLPLQGDVAISPLFNEKDPRILIGATVVTEYWADHDLAKPAALVGPAGTWLTIAFSPAFVDDNTIFVGGIRPDTTGKMRPTVNRCAGSVCENVVFDKGFDAPWLRPSPSFARDNTVFAFTSHVLFRSVDGGTTFRSSTPSFAAHGSFRDVLVARSGEVFAAVTGSPRIAGGLYRSRNGGVSWTGGRISIRGFESGVTRIVALPDERLIALGATFGIACSGDQGATWSRRCSA